MLVVLLIYSMACSLGALPYIHSRHSICRAHHFAIQFMATEFAILLRTKIPHRKQHDLFLGFSGLFFISFAKRKREHSLRFMITNHFGLIWNKTVANARHYKLSQFSSAHEFLARFFFPGSFFFLWKKNNDLFILCAKLFFSTSAVTLNWNLVTVWKHNQIHLKPSEVDVRSTKPNIQCWLMHPTHELTDPIFLDRFTHIPIYSKLFPKITINHRYKCVINVTFRIAGNPSEKCVFVCAFWFLVISHV